VDGGFDTRRYFLLWLRSSRLTGCCRFRLCLLRPGRLADGGHIRLRGRLRYWLRRGIRFGEWSGSSLYITPPSGDVIPSFAQVHLLGRGPCPLNFRNGGVVCGGDLSDTIGLLICKDRLHILPLNTAPVFCCVVVPTVTALGLLPWGRAPTLELGASQAMHRGSYSQLSCVCLMVLQRVLCSVPIVVTYVSIDT
jgi:hypothetical protein